MGSVVLTTLSVFLGLFFVFVGTIKVTPQISRELHREIRRDFVQYAKHFALADSGLKVTAKQYRLAIGWLEIVTGAVLAIVPGFFKQIANVFLLVLTLNDFYTHAAMADKFERTAPSIVFSLMLSCRLIIYWQVRRRDAKEAAKAAKVTSDHQSAVTNGKEKQAPPSAQSIKEKKDN